jgi:hypothetical protein
LWKPTSGAGRLSRVDDIHCSATPLYRGVSTKGENLCQSIFEYFRIVVSEATAGFSSNFLITEKKGTGHDFPDIKADECYYPKA